MAITLLLADDSPTIAKILQLALQSEPYEIKSVLTAEDALSELRKNPPYFFLIDLTLPGKNGYEFARLIRADSKLNKIRVVLLSSAFDPVDQAEFEACGADGLIQKPFDPSELRAKLRSIQDASPKFPAGSKVTGSLSGHQVTRDATNSKIETPLPAASAGTEDLSKLFESNAVGSADSILAGLMGGEAESPPAKGGKIDSPPAFTPPPAKVEDLSANDIVTLDLDENDMIAAPPPMPKDEITASFATPPGGTAMIDMNLLEEAGVSAPPQAPAPVAPKKAEEPLSANAQALAAFFSAEIQSQGDAPPPPPKKAAPPAAPATPQDEFDASLSSIEWDEGPAEASLNAWSSSQPKQTAVSGPMPKPAPAPAPAPAKRAATAASATADAMMFDTGGSNFRFADDYVTRITKSFTGTPNEAIPETQAAAPVFAQKSDDRPAPKAAALGGFSGGTWSDADVQKIEQIVREEVQMVVREVAEKIAWEVIPELAENIIRKELDKVLKEMEPS